MEPAEKQIAKKQSSSTLSTLASKYISFDAEKLAKLAEQNSGEAWEQLCVDIRSPAASVLSQDETKSS